MYPTDGAQEETGLPANLGVLTRRTTGAGEPPLLSEQSAAWTANVRPFTMRVSTQTVDWAGDRDFERRVKGRLAHDSVATREPCAAA
jgi:hypothetical protein